MLERSDAGTLSICAKTLAAKQALAGEKVTVLGLELSSHQPHYLDTCHYVDIFNVSSSVPLTDLIAALGDVGAQQLHCTRFRARRGPSLSFGHVRVYLNSPVCPDCLTFDGRPADQLVWKGTYHPIRHRDTPSTKPQASYFRRSKSSIALGDRRNDTFSFGAGDHTTSSMDVDHDVLTCRYQVSAPPESPARGCTRCSSQLW